MSAKRAARQYATALFDVASKAGSLDRVAGDIASLETLFATSELRRTFEAPTVSPTKKKAVLEAVLNGAGDVTDEVRRLLGLLADSDRLPLLGEILAAFADKSRASGRVVPAELVTAMPLSPAVRDKLSAALAHAVGRDVTVSERVDPSIIGGIVARVGSVVFDGSMTRQVQKLREKLIAGS